MTDISKLGEFGLIRHLTDNIKIKNKSTVNGVGDDCAVLHYPDSEVLVTTDMLMEGVHFDLTYIDLQHLGYKSAMVNISDIFAMNGTPRQLTVSIALNYGGRQEICDAAKKIAEDVKSGKIDVSDIDENLFNDYIYTKNIPDPDLIIRPSGEERLSNFLLWQCAYSEFWFSNVCWPDFTPDKLEGAVADFQKRNRRFGGV